MVLNTPPTNDSGVMKNTFRIVNCSKLLAHSPTRLPRRPNTIATPTTQKTNSPTPATDEAPNSAAITNMPSAVTTERNTTVTRTPLIIST